MRVVFCTPVQQVKAKDEEPARKMYYKSFTPVRIKKVLPLTPSSEEQEPMENNFEDLRHTEEKINVWLNHTGKVASLDKARYHQYLDRYARIVSIYVKLLYLIIDVSL